MCTYRNPIHIDCMRFTQNHDSFVNKNNQNNIWKSHAMSTALIFIPSIIHCVVFFSLLVFSSAFFLLLQRGLTMCFHMYVYFWCRCVCIFFWSLARATIPMYVQILIVSSPMHTNTILMVCYHILCWVALRTLTHIRIRLLMSAASALIPKSRSLQTYVDWPKGPFSQYFGLDRHTDSFI